MVTSGAQSATEASTPKPTFWRRISNRTKYWVGVVLVVATGLFALSFGWGSLPSGGDIWRVVLTAQGGWVVAALGAQIVSLLMFALQQRQLVGVFGGRLSVLRAFGITLARTGISMSMPAGAAVSVGFAVRQFRKHGVELSAATALGLLTGAQSLVSLVAIYLVWLATVGAQTMQVSVAAIVVAVLAIVITFAVMSARRRRSGPGRVSPQPPASTHARGIVGRLVHRTFELLKDTSRQATRLSPRQWLAGIGFAVANWLADMVCLLAAAWAFRLDVPILTLMGAYLAIQLVRQIPLTPGGIGVVEASLIIALTTAGATAATATAVVFTYRLVSCWLIWPVGLIAWTALGIHRGVSDTAPTEQPVPVPVSTAE